MTPRIKGYEQQLNDQFLEMPEVSRNQATIYVHEAIEKIKQEVDNLSQIYDFRHRFQRPEDMDYSLTVRSVKRIKFRFKCKNPYCRQFKGRTNKQQRSYEIQRSWTSYNGLVQFSFYLDDSHRDQMPELVYSLRLYKQKCWICQQWGKTGFIESMLEKLISFYCRLIINSMQKRERVKEIVWISKPKEKAVSKKPLSMRTFHKFEMCEGCILGLCKRQREESQSRFIPRRLPVLIPMRRRRRRT